MNSVQFTMFVRFIEETTSYRFNENQLEIINSFFVGTPRNSLQFFQRKQKRDF